MAAAIILVPLLAAGWVAWGLHRTKQAFQRYKTLMDSLSEADDISVLTEAASLWREWRWPYTPARRAQEELYVQVALRSLIPISAQPPDSSIRTQQVAEAFDLSPDTRTALDAEAFRRLVWASLADQRLTVEEQTILAAVQTSLGIPDDAVRDELATIDEYLRAQALERDHLPVITSPIKLQRGEVCHHATVGALLRRRVLRTFVVSGQRQIEEGLVPIREGEVYLTSKRILVVGDGTSTVRHTAILDVEVDYDAKTVTITQDGRQAPVILRVSDPLYSGRLIELLAGPADTSAGQ